MSEPYMELEDEHYMAFLLTNKGNHAIIAELDSVKFVQEHTDIEEHTIHNEKDLPSMIYSILFNYCPIHGNVILLVYEDGKDRIQNIKHQKVIPKMRRKQLIPKNTFINSLKKYMFSIDKK